MGAAVLTRPTFTLADRLKIQQERSRDRDYMIIGRLTSVHFEGQRDTSGLSQSKPRWHNAEQSKHVPAHMAPFSEKQTMLWCSLSLDWLTNKNAPIIALSRDRQDLLLPNGMTALPDLPDPRWIPKMPGEIPPRIPQLLTGCPVVGDRVTDKITDRKGRVYGVLHPITELCIMLAGATGGFGRIRGIVDPADGTHLALLIDDSHPHQLRGYFVGGKFTFGGQ
jgi:hypothetical protein